MTLAGKTDGFTADDLVTCARTAGMKTRRGQDGIAVVASAVRHRPDFATPAAVSTD